MIREQVESGWDPKEAGPLAQIHHAWAICDACGTKFDPDPFSDHRTYVEAANAATLIKQKADREHICPKAPR